MRSKTGFSLVELLIVMAIIAILIAVAYPLYTSHLVKGRRNQAEIALLYLASQLESFYSVQNSYQGATLESLGVNLFTDDHSYPQGVPWWSGVWLGSALMGVSITSKRRLRPALKLPLRCWAADARGVIASKLPSAASAQDSQVGRRLSCPACTSGMAIKSTVQAQPSTSTMLRASRSPPIQAMLRLQTQQLFVQPPHFLYLLLLLIVREQIGGSLNTINHAHVNAERIAIMRCPRFRLSR